MVRSSGSKPPHVTSTSQSRDLSPVRRIRLPSSDHTLRSFSLFSYGAFKSPHCFFRSPVVFGDFLVCGVAPTVLARKRPPLKPERRLGPLRPLQTIPSGAREASLSFSFSRRTRLSSAFSNAPLSSARLEAILGSLPPRLRCHFASRTMGSFFFFLFRTRGVAFQQCPVSTRDSNLQAMRAQSPFGADYTWSKARPHFFLHLLTGKPVSSFPFRWIGEVSP